MFPFIVKTPGINTVSTELPALLLCTRKGFVPRDAGGRTAPACSGSSASRAGWLRATQCCQHEPQAGSKVSHSQPAFFVCRALLQKKPSLTSQCAPARLAGSSAHHAQTARLVPGQHPAPPGSCAQIPIVLQDIVLKSRPCLFGAATIPPSKEYGKLACPGSPRSLSRQEVCAGSMRTSEKKVSEEAKRRRKDSWLSFYLLPSLNPLT